METGKSSSSYWKQLQVSTTSGFNGVLVNSATNRSSRPWGRSMEGQLVNSLLTVVRVTRFGGNARRGVGHSQFFSKSDSTMSLFESSG